MEEAKINKENDSLLSVDDLVMEIGRQHVEIMNTQKRANLLVGNISKQVKDFGILKLEKEKVEKENINITKSNKAFIENNRNLDNRLSLVNNESSKSRQELSNKDVEIKEIKNELLTKIKLLKDELKEKEDNLSSEIKLLKDKNQELLDDNLSLGELNDDLLSKNKLLEKKADDNIKKKKAKQKVKK